MALPLRIEHGAVVGADYFAVLGQHVAGPRGRFALKHVLYRYIAEKTQPLAVWPRGIGQAELVCKHTHG